MRNIVYIVVFSIAFVLSSFAPLNNPTYKIKKIVIDAGHGGKDPGCHGKSTKEKDITLAVALLLGDMITKYLPDVKVIYTRKTDDFVEVHKRAALANERHADLFISIHCNANKKKHIQGTETYTMGLDKNNVNLEVSKRENGVILLEEGHETMYEGFDPNSPESYIIFSLHQNAYFSNSIKLADKIEDQFKNRAGRESRGVKQAGFWVLWKTSMPSVLIELGFLTNIDEESDLADELTQTYLASAIFRAFRDYKHEIESMN